MASEIKCGKCDKVLLCNESSMFSQTVYKCKNCGFFACDEHNNSYLCGKKDIQDRKLKCPNSTDYNEYNDFSHNFSRYTRCVYCDDYEFLDDDRIFANSSPADKNKLLSHLFEIHHLFQCKKCDTLFKNKKEEFDHILSSKECLDRMLYNEHGSLIVMLMKKVQNMKREIDSLKRNTRLGQKSNFRHRR